MTSINEGTIGKLRRRAGLSMLVGLLIGAFGAEPAADTVYAVGNPVAPGLPSELYRFNEDGSMDRRWGIPESLFALSLTNLGSSLYVAGAGGAINRYDLGGNFLGQFADVSGLAGQTPLFQTLESDSAGSVYAAFGGAGGAARTSFRIDPNGNVSQTFSHESLVFPRGIDATGSGDVYIVNSVSFFFGNRLFKFNSAGTYIDDYAIPETVFPSDMAIDEIDEEIFISDEFGKAIQVYDISSGEPIFSNTIPAPSFVLDVFIEQGAGRILGTYVVVGSDSAGSFTKFVGFEVMRDGTVVNLYTEDAAPREQSVRSIVALPDSDSDGIPDVIDPDRVAAVVSALPVGSFGSASDPRGQRNALLNRLDNIEVQILAGDVEGALRSLANLRRSFDGCGGSSWKMPDFNDWINDCGAQQDVQDAIDALAANLSLMM